SGIQPETVEWLRSEFFPEFEERHDVVIEDLAIGWGGPRSEKLTVAFAAGVAPDVIVGNGGQTNVIPLDRYFESWSESSAIVPVFLEPMRDTDGVLRAIPHEAEVRGLAYSKEIA